MKRPAVIFLIALISLIMISSCSPSVRPTDVFDILKDVTPIYFPTPSAVPTIYSSYQQYLDWVEEFSYWYLSPDGLQIIIEPSPFILGKDHFDIIFSEDHIQKIEIPVDNNLLKIPLDAIKDGKIDLYGNYWSPDSKAFLIVGQGFINKNYAFLVIVDISDPNNIKKAVVKWKYEGDPYITWAPDSSRLLIWFGPEKPLGKYFPDVVYTEKAWILDRQGNRLKEFDVEGLRSPFWVKDQLFGIKNESEIWQIFPEKNSAKNLLTSEFTIAKIVDRNQENTQLLLIENESPYDLIIYDIESRIIIDRIPSQLELWPGQVRDCRVVRTPSHYTGIGLINYIVFDWTTHTIRNYGDDINIVFWSPVVNGFIGENSSASLKLVIVYP